MITIKIPKHSPRASILKYTAIQPLHTDIAKYTTLQPFRTDIAKYTTLQPLRTDIAKYITLQPPQVHKENHMAYTLPRKTAQKIVETVKDVCGHNINFINTSGIIFASTDESRIGDFHEIGKKVIDTQEIIEVETDHSFYGTNKGVNIPFVYKHEVIAAIGISGVPDEVRQYAILAQKITNLILREHELDFMHFGHQNQIRSIMYALMEGKPLSQEFLLEFLAAHQLSADASYRTILIKIDSRYHPSNLSMLENHINQFFTQIPSALYTFHFPNEYRVILTDESYEIWKKRLLMFAEQFQKILLIGIGGKDSIHRQNISFDQAEIACKSLSNTSDNIACYDDLTLEMLTASIPENITKTYLEKTIEKLDADDIQLLRQYFKNDMSLKDTAEQLYVHKNTVQYQLNRIEQRTGYNPRKFRDAVVLYMGTRLKYEA